MSTTPSKTKTAPSASITPELARLHAARDGEPWRQWGPYLSERQWGTVREDYSQDGNAWDYFSHDQARSRAYHWGEDGLAGLRTTGQNLRRAVYRRNLSCYQVTFRCN